MREFFFNQNFKRERKRIYTYMNFQKLKNNVYKRDKNNNNNNIEYIFLMNNIIYI